MTTLAEYKPFDPAAWPVPSLPHTSPVSYLRGRKELWLAFERV
jgi:hypothetical protein